MENETPESQTVLQRIKALAHLVWTWKPNVLKGYAWAGGVLPLVVWLAFGLFMYVQAAKVMPTASLHGATNRPPMSPLPIAVAVKTSPAPSSPAEMYLDLLKKDSDSRPNRRPLQPPYTGQRGMVSNRRAHAEQSAGKTLKPAASIWKGGRKTPRRWLGRDNWTTSSSASWMS